MQKAAREKARNTSCTTAASHEPTRQRLPRAKSMTVHTRLLGIALVGAVVAAYLRHPDVVSLNAQSVDPCAAMASGSTPTSRSSSETGNRRRKSDPLIAMIVGVILTVSGLTVRRSLSDVWFRCRQADKLPVMGARLQCYRTLATSSLERIPWTSEMSAYD